MLVVDASVLAVALLDSGPDGAAARDRLRGERLCAAALIDLEVVSVWRGLVRGGAVTSQRAELALHDLSSVPLERLPHAALIHRCWELRDNLTPYDAAYVALAEALGCTLLTADRRLARSTGPACRIAVMSGGA